MSASHTHRNSQIHQVDFAFSILSLCTFRGVENPLILCLKFVCKKGMGRFAGRDEESSAAEQPCLLHA